MRTAASLLGILTAAPAMAHEAGLAHFEPHPDPLALALAVTALAAFAWLAIGRAR